MTSSISGINSNDRLAESIASYDASPEAYVERFSRLDMSPYLDRFCELLANRPGATVPRVLDLGCGTGRDMAGFALRGCSVVGVDLSSNLLSRVESASAGGRVQGDLRLLPFSADSFDGAWAMASLVHLPRDGVIQALREAYRVVRPRGFLFLSVPTGTGPEWRDDGHGGRRWFNYFRSTAEVHDVVTEAGLELTELEEGPGVAHGHWINAVCRTKGL
jgi:SAM-dependent methyltransferase